MEIELPGASRTSWDWVHATDLAVGHHTMKVRAGERPEVTLDIEAVADADSIVARPPDSPLVIGKTSMVCFSAKAAGRHIAGLAWTFSSDNGETSTPTWIARNCTNVRPAREGALTLTARAGGQVLAAPFMVAP